LDAGSGRKILKIDGQSLVLQRILERIPPTIKDLIALKRTLNINEITIRQLKLPLFSSSHRE